MIGSALGGAIAGVVCTFIVTSILYKDETK